MVNNHFTDKWAKSVPPPPAPHPPPIQTLLSTSLDVINGSPLWQKSTFSNFMKLKLRVFQLNVFVTGMVEIG